jgi:hypothetical protein
MRLGEPELPALLVSHHRPGFYMRVVREGHIQASDQIIKTRTGPHEISVTDIDALLYLPGRDNAKLRLAVQIPALSPGWQQSFRADRRGAARRPGCGTGARHRARRAASSGLDRIPAVARDQGGQGNGDCLLDLPGRRRRNRASDGPERQRGR